MYRVPIVAESLTEVQKDYIDRGPFYLWRLKILDQLDQKLELIVKEWPSSIGSINRGRTLFRTNKGMFGLGHVAIQREDIVTLLWGIKSPIILRPRKDRADGGFTFCGGCLCRRNHAWGASEDGTGT